MLEYHIIAANSRARLMELVNELMAEDSGWALATGSLVVTEGRDGQREYLREMVKRTVKQSNVSGIVQSVRVG